MQRSEKAAVVEDLGGIFQAAGVVIVSHYVGMTVSEMTTLRGRFRESGAKIRVIKNRLAKRALEGAPCAGLSDLFTGPTAIAWSDDPVAAPRVLTKYAKENEKLVILGGAMGATILDPNGVKALADLPSLDELRGRLIGMLNTPAQRLATLMQAPGGQLARVLAAYADKAKDAA